MTFGENLLYGCSVSLSLDELKDYCNNVNTKNNELRMF
jgi:hypothetical protein